MYTSIDEEIFAEQTKQAEGESPENVSKIEKTTCEAGEPNTNIYWRNKIRYFSSTKHVFTNRDEAES